MIPFNRPSLTGNEQDYMLQAVKEGHISGDGRFTRECHHLLEDTLGVRAALLTTSCTHALEMTAILLDLQPGDEVIIPAYTFVSTVNAFVLRGARPVFSDIRPDTLNIDESQLESLVTPRTKAIVVVHYAGVGCELDKICALAKHHNLVVIEDNAHGLYGKYRGQWLGTFGALATLSFHETKNFSCGEGGALLINDPDFIERAEIVREKGTDRSRFFRGQVDKYTWVDVGSSYLPSDMLAAYLLAQLESRAPIMASRKRIFDHYQAHLATWASRHGIVLPTIPSWCDQSYHMFYMLLPSLDARQRLIKHLRQTDIMSVFHYLPLHLSPKGQSFGQGPGSCPVTERISDQLLRLPMYNDLSDRDLDHITQTICSFTP